MPSLLNRLRDTSGEERDLALTVQDYVNLFQFGGIPYMVQGGTPGQEGEKLDASFQGYVQGAYKTNGVVFACIEARRLLFSEARFQWQQMRTGKPGKLFGTPDLAILEQPAPNQTTANLLSRAILDVDLAGNFYAVRRAGQVRRLRPDWVTIVTGSRTGSELDTELIGYMYKPGGPASPEDPVALLPEEVAHFAPTPDPLARYRGLSWLSPIVEEILGDRSAVLHKKQFFDQGAKLGYVVTLDKDTVKTVDQFNAWVNKFKVGHEGALNAYKTLFLAAGADVKVVGANLQEIDFKNVQGHGETRICAAARVPPIIVGVSEGLDAATYSNYGQARRAFADATLRPLWRDMAGAFASILPSQPGARLWYDASDISFLQEDEKDEAEIQFTQAQAMRQLIDAGFEADSVVDAVTSGDLTRLVHSGLFSVQLQPAGAGQGDPGSNGAVPALLNGQS